MNQDIETALQGWDYKPGLVQARVIQAQDGRQIIQMRVDLGVLQMEIAGRPDGERPHGHPNYLEHLRHQSRLAEQKNGHFVLSEEQCEEADREFMQYYYRRLCCLALRFYARGVADADHTLAFMDFVKDHSPNEEWTLEHEKFRGFVIFHRTQAASALALEKDQPEAAIDEIREGLERIRAFLASYDKEELMEEDGMVHQLRKMEQNLRQLHKIDATLREQLEKAVAAEDYEVAAKLRDALKRRE
jgi:hypothetical protein